MEFSHQIFQVVFVNREVSFHPSGDKDILFLVVLVETETAENLHVDGFLHLLDLTH